MISYPLARLIRRLHPALIFLMTLSLAHAQDPLRFQEEVAQLNARYDSIWDSKRNCVVFTGSSSVRLWQELPSLFPRHQIINTGFGGSHTSDLLAYCDALILRYKPSQVFIYEGDNDIGQAKKPRRILNDYRQLLQKIQDDSPGTRVVLIAPKPSLSRWHLRRKYKKLNRKLNRLCSQDTLLQFADPWKVMLDGRQVREDLFIEDGLHMNQKGYALWYELIKPYIN